MKYKLMGKSGLKVSELCFGTMSFGGDADKKTSEDLFHRCRDEGINIFDCANVYQQGAAEEILGECIKDCRDEVIVTTKAYFPTGSDVNARGASRYHIMKAVEKSLKRLKTDRIDVFFIHRYDDLTSPEETLRALNDLISQGKILYAGASNFAAWQTEKCLGISEGRQWNRFECLQPMYNLVKRQAEVEILPMAEEENLAVFSYSPLGGGLLTGKYGRGKRPEFGRLTENKMYQTRYGEEWMTATAEKFVRFAEDHGYNPVSLAVSWAAGHPAVTAPIIGARNLEQLEDSLGALKIEMTDELRRDISALTPEPPPATDRNEERTVFSYGDR